MRLVYVLVLAALAAACSREVRTATRQASSAPAPTPTPTPTPSPGPQPANAGAIAQVNAQGYAAPAPDTAGAGPNPVLIKAEVLLDRAHFSPGVIDGRFGDNVHNAISAYETAHGLPVDGQLTPTVWNSLGADRAPVLAAYVTSPEDVKGPFIAKVPTGFRDQAKLPSLGYTSPVQALAARFHMSEDLLTGLNPGVDLSRAGAPIVVAAAGVSDLPSTVARIEIDKDRKAVRAYDDAGRLIADYPATVGSAERPSPSGAFKVAGVAWNPTYHYDPSVLTFGHIGHKLEIKPGPNNPVGVVWIALSKPTFGVHGAPDPSKVGKTASHGCVRLTNWDATQLARAVRPGTTVDFVTSASGQG